MNKSEAIDIMRNLQSMIVSPHKQDKETVFAIQMGIDALKAQEPKFVSDIAEAILGHKPKVKVGHCPSCGVLMSETDKFCRKCGQAVKWK